MYRPVLALTLALAACHEASHVTSQQAVAAAPARDAAELPRDAAELPRNAADATQADDCDVDPTPREDPPQLACASPPRAVVARLEATVAAERKRTHTEARLTFACELRGGWLASAWFVPEGGMMGSNWTELWLVPATGAAKRLPDQRLGPVYDFNGDGTPEPSTITTTDGAFGVRTLEVNVWFDGDAAKQTYRREVGRDIDWYWATAGGRPVLLIGDFAGSRARFTPGGTVAVGWPGRRPTELADVPRELWAQWRCGRKRDPIPAGDAAEPTYADAVLALLPPARGACPAPDAAAQAKAETAIRTELQRQADERGSTVAPAKLTWGCTSGGRTLVGVEQLERGEDLYQDSALWSVDSAGTAAPVYAARTRWGAEGEFAHHYYYALVGHGDLDGDGDAETVIRYEDHEGTMMGSTMTYAIAAAGAPVVIARDPGAGHTPWDRDPRFVGAPSGKTDVLLILPSYAGEGRAWDWEHFPPHVFALDGGKPAILSPRAWIAPTAAERAKLRARLDR